MGVKGLKLRGADNAKTHPWKPLDSSLGLYAILTDSLTVESICIQWGCEETTVTPVKMREAKWQNSPAHFQQGETWNPLKQPSVMATVRW